MEHDPPARRRIVVDGSNIATEGRNLPSLAQLDEAIRAFLEEYRGFTTSDVTVVVDASFGHRIDPSEVPAFDQAVEHGEMISPPAGAIGRGDGFILRIAEKSGALVLSNDSFQEFHAERPWLFEPGRLIGGKPVPGVGWIFTPRTPVRGAVSRSVTSKSKRSAKEAAAPADQNGDDAATTSDGNQGRGRSSRGDKAAVPAKAAKSNKRATKASLAVTGDHADPGDEVIPTRVAGGAKAAKTTKAAKSTKATKASKTTSAKDGASGDDGDDAAEPVTKKAAKAAKAQKTAKSAKTAKATKSTKTAKSTKATKATSSARSAADDVAPEDVQESDPEESRTVTPKRSRRGRSPAAGDDAADAGERATRSAASGEALNEPMTFLTFVADHPVGGTFEGEVVSFTSHGAHVDVGGMLCHVPLRYLADPPPNKARQVLTKGEVRTFELVSLDAARRRAELALPGLAG